MVDDVQALISRSRVIVHTYIVHSVRGEVCLRDIDFVVNGVLPSTVRLCEKEMTDIRKWFLHLFSHSVVSRSRRNPSFLPPLNKKDRWKQ